MYKSKYLFAVLQRLLEQRVILEDKVQNIQEEADLAVVEEKFCGQCHHPGCSELAFQKASVLAQKVQMRHLAYRLFA